MGVGRLGLDSPWGGDWQDALKVDKRGAEVTLSELQLNRKVKCVKRGDFGEGTVTSCGYMKDCIVFNKLTVHH